MFYNNKEFNDEVNSCQFVTKASDHRLSWITPWTTIFADPTCKMTPVQNLKFSGKYLHRMCIMLCAIKKWHHHVLVHELGKYFILYSGKYSNIYR